MPTSEDGAPALKDSAVQPFHRVAMAMNDVDRRRDARARISIPAEVVRRSDRIAVQVVDASYRGLFLRMNPGTAPPVRELIKLRLTLPTGVLFAHAVVVRHTDEPGGRARVGLRFFALNGQERSDWESFVTSILHGRARAA